MSDAQFLPGTSLVRRRGKGGTSEPAPLKVLRLYGDRLREGALVFSALDAECRKNLKSRQSYYEKKYGPLEESEKFTARRIVTVAMIERLISPGDRKWKMHQDHLRRLRIAALRQGKPDPATAEVQPQGADDRQGRPSRSRQAREARLIAEIREAHARAQRASEEEIAVKAEQIEEIRVEHQTRVRELAVQRRWNAQLERDLRTEREHLAEVERALKAERDHTVQLQEDIEAARKARAQAEKALVTEWQRTAQTERESQAARDAREKAEGALALQRQRTAEAERDAQAERVAGAAAEGSLVAERDRTVEAERESQAARDAREKAELALALQRQRTAEAERDAQAERRARAQVEQDFVAEQNRTAQAEGEIRVEHDAREQAERALALQRDRTAQARRDAHAERDAKDLARRALAAERGAEHDAQAEPEDKVHHNRFQNGIDRPSSPVTPSKPAAEPTMKTDKKLAPYVPVNEPVVVEILRRYADRLDGPKPLHLRDIDLRLQNGLRSRYHQYKLSHPPEAVPKLSSDTVVTRPVVERMLSSFDRAWMAKHRSGTSAPVAPVDPPSEAAPTKNSYAVIRRTPVSGPATARRRAGLQAPVISSVVVHPPRTIDLARRPRPEAPKATVASAGVYRLFGPLQLRENLNIFDFFENEPFWQQALPKGVPLSQVELKDPSAILEWNRCKEMIAPFLHVYAGRRPAGQMAPQMESAEDEAEESPHAMKGRSALSPAEIAAFEKLQRRLDSPMLTTALVNDLRKATAYMQAFAAHHPIPSAQDPENREEALVKARKFLRLHSESQDTNQADTLFVTQWLRPISLRLLRLSDFEKLDPQAYKLLAESGRNAAFNVRHALRSQGATQLAAELTPPPASPQPASAPA